MKKKKRLTAIEKFRKASEILKSHRWILDFEIIPPNSPDDSAGYDARVSFRYNSRGQGKFPFQVLSSNNQYKKHLKKHPGVPYIAVSRGYTTRDTVYKYVLFLFFHGALNEDKIKGLPSGMSFLCPLKCGRK